MTGEEQAAILEEIIAHCSPDIAEKMRIMYQHLAYSVIPDDMAPATLRVALAVSADLLTDYPLVNGSFTHSQRAVLAVEAMDIVNKIVKEIQQQKHQTRH